MRAGQTTGDVKSKQWLVGPYHDPQYFSALFMSQFVPLAGLGTDGYLQKTSMAVISNFEYILCPSSHW